MNSIRGMLQMANSRKKYPIGVGNSAYPTAQGSNAQMVKPQVQQRTFFNSNVPQQSNSCHYIVPQTVQQPDSATMRTPPEIPAQIPAPVVKSGAIYRDLMKRHDRFTQRHL